MKPFSVLLVALFAVTLAGCSAADSAGQTCIDAISAAVGSDFSNPIVTETLDSPSAVDIRGSYDGGEFACGLSKSPLTVQQAILYLDNGDIQTVIS